MFHFHVKICKILYLEIPIVPNVPNIHSIGILNYGFYLFRDFPKSLINEHSYFHVKLYLGMTHPSMSYCKGGDESQPQVHGGNHFPFVITPSMLILRVGANLVPHVLFGFVHYIVMNTYIDFIHSTNLVLNTHVLEVTN